jgi:glycerol-3-phosphate dehydrogenase
VLLERAGIRTTLLCRTREQAEELSGARENERYLDGVELPRGLRVSALDPEEDQFRRADAIFRWRSSAPRRSTSTAPT